jgi:hypothetical protein
LKKIISLFQRNYETDRLVRNEVVPGAEWVIAGEGVPTRKYDGSCCAIIKGVFYKRYDLKKGRVRPDGFIPAQDPDPVTGHWPGWLMVGWGSKDKWFRVAIDNSIAAKKQEGLGEFMEDGTYEACGPHFQGNPEEFLVDALIPHGIEKLSNVPRDFDGIREYLKDGRIEGIVWHHPDGRMVKIKAKDFGMRRQS